MGHDMHDRMLDYINNTGQSPLPIVIFDEDWEPTGERARLDMLAAGLIETDWTNIWIKHSPYPFGTVGAILSFKSNRTPAPLVYGMPPAGCNICSQPFGRYYYDARVTLQDRKIWAWVCQPCFQSRWGGLGIGSGQKYDTLTNIQIAGGRTTS